MIRRIQEHLEALYAIRSEHRAEHFLVTPEVARALGGSGTAREELLVLEDGDALELAIYLSPEVIELLGRLESLPPVQVLDAALDSFCQATEGVSHFLYLTRSAAQERKVSLLELEAQAEVDKFATCALSGWRRGVRFIEELFWRLFERISYLPHLGGPERWRYEEANRLARNYCHRLLRHVAAGRMDPFLSDLRYCYRLGAEAKLRHLAQSA